MRLRAGLEGADDPLHRLMEEQPRRALQQLVAELEIHVERHLAAAILQGRGKPQVECMCLNGPSIYSVSIRRVPCTRSP